MLAEALRSLLVQTDSDWGAVVADDGESPTAEPVVAAVGLAGRVAVVRVSTRSPGGARNAAFAHGETAFPGASIVAFLDDDDAWLPLHLSTVRAALARSPSASLAHTGALTQSQGAFSAYHGRETRPAEGASAFRPLLRRNTVATSSAAMPAPVFRSLGGFRADVGHGEDWDLWLRASRTGPLVFSPEPTVVYRAHPGNTSLALSAKAGDHARVLESWWARRDALAGPDRRALARALARRHASHVRRLLRDGAPRAVARRAARAHAATLFRLRTWLAAFAPRGRTRPSA
jgi:glycosyltransferase involved in cell wall biosynthesis